MTLMPFFIKHTPRHHFDQHIGIALSPEDFPNAAIAPMLTRDYYRPWKQNLVQKDFGCNVKDDKEKIQISLDVQHYAPEEISVKTADGFIIIEGKHDEKKDYHGHISRQFTRRYVLPDCCNPETVESKLSSDGVLTVVAPKTIKMLKNERTVPITQTGPVRAEVKESGKVEANGPEK